MLPTQCGQGRSARRAPYEGALYFSDELIEPNFNFNVEPRLLITAMMASAMPAAIRPYSIAVAPELVGQEAADGLHGLTTNSED